MSNHKKWMADTKAWEQASQTALENGEPVPFFWDFMKTKEKTVMEAMDERYPLPPVVEELTKLGENPHEFRQRFLPRLYLSTIPAMRRDMIIHHEQDEPKRPVYHKEEMALSKKGSFDRTEEMERIVGNASGS